MCSFILLWPIFIPHYLVCLGQGSFALEGNMYSVDAREIIYRCPFCLVDWWCCWVQLCPYWFSASSICLFLIHRWNLQLVSGFQCSSFHFCQFCHVLWWISVRCVHRLLCLLGEWTPFLFCDNPFSLHHITCCKIHSIQNKYGHFLDSS